MGVSTILVVLVLIWGVSAVLSGWLAARKGRSVRPWTLLGVVLGPLSLLIHAVYPPVRRHRRTLPAVREAGRRAACCHHCQYRPAVDVLITTVPADPESRRVILNELAREYGIQYADAGRMLEKLPVAGYRHIQPTQVGEYVRRLETAGAGVSVVPSAAGPAKPS
jgi:hypothetical protein